MIESLDDLERVRAECKRLVTRRSVMSATAAAVPAPGLDVLADVTLLTRLLPEINQRFGLSDKQVEKLDPQLAQQIVLVAKNLGNNFIANAITTKLVIAVLKRMGIRVASKSITRFIPFLGQAVAASISFGAMKMLGNQHVDDCFETIKRARFPNSGER